MKVSVAMFIVVWVLSDGYNEILSVDEVAYVQASYKVNQSVVVAQKHVD